MNRREFIRHAGLVSAGVRPSRTTVARGVGAPVHISRPLKAGARSS